MKDLEKRILLVFHLNFLRRNMGCANAVYFPVKILKSLGFNVDFFSTNLVDNFEDFNILNRENIISNFFLVDVKKKISFFDKIKHKVKKALGLSRTYYKRSRVTDAVLFKFQEILSKNNYDFIYIHYIDWADLIRYSTIPSNTKLVYHMHDSCFIQYFYTDGTNDIGKSFEDELVLLKYFHKFIFLSFDEMLFWSKLCPEKEIYFIPPSNELTKLPKVQKTIDILYIAAYNPYNIKAACWFLDEVYPHLYPNTSITFCGKFLSYLSSEYLKRISDNKITTIDFADDLEALYANTKIVIVPILSGTGIKIKTLEAMSFSIPVVTTLLGVDGFPDKYENGCLVSDNPLEFAFNIRKLLDDDDFYNAVIEKQNTYYTKHFSFEKNVKSTSKVFENKKNKAKMIYDATFLAQCSSKGAFRTGLFFVSYNILKQFSNMDLFSITLLIQDGHDFSHFQNDSLLSQFPVLRNPENRYKRNIKNHKQRIKSSRNIFKKALFCLKILKNYLYMYALSDKNNSLSNSFDIYFSPMYPAPDVIKKNPNVKQFIILHDAIPLIYPQYFPDITSSDYWFNRLIKAMNKDTYYFCVSDSTKNDFLKFCGSKLDNNKLFVTHNAPQQTYSPDYNKNKLSATLSKYNNEITDTDRKYILSFCTQEPRKNLLFTVICFIKFIKKHSIDDLYFYLCGAQWDFFINQLNEQIDNFNELKNKIVRLGYIDDEDVNILYSNSLFFTYLSQYEGFGLPPLEAMQAGTPVICSNNSSLPEVVGDAAITITYNDEEACIKAFEDLYFNEDLRKHYIEKGLKRAKLFSWEKTLKSMCDEIFQIVSD
jgi:glycosyltransferase involved in cell wall biosynthesis